MLRPQLLSLKVDRAPVPGSFPVNSVRCDKKRPVGGWRVVVKESQVDSLGRVQKLLGWPNLGVSRESWCQSDQAGSEKGFGEGATGGEVLVPILEAEVMEPRVMKQMSLS
jgi:hypothetical protein